MSNFGFDASTIALLVGGALGALARAVWTRGQTSLSFNTVPDVVIGAALGILLPGAGALLGSIGLTVPLPPMDGWTPVHKGALMVLVAAATVDLVKERVLHQFEPKDRRATDQPGPTDQPLPRLDSPK